MRRNLLFNELKLYIYFAISNNPHACCVYDIQSVSMAITVVMPHRTTRNIYNKSGVKYFC